MTKWDKIVILVILLISTSLFFIINMRNLNHGNKYISVQINGEEYKQITFENSNEKMIYPIISEFGKNVIEIQNGKVRVIEADCPDKLDVKQGYIKNTGEIIVCVPNRFVIEIKGSKNLDNIDAINY